MKHIEDKIRKFSKNREHVMEALAILKVGHERGDSAEVIMEHLLAHTLLKFNGIPLRRPQS